MRKFRCVIIDHDQQSVNLLTDFIRQDPHLLLVKTYGNPVKALADVSLQDRLDFIFLEVVFPETNSIHLVPQLSQRCRFIIFTTKHIDYAVDAFNVLASHFLVKPISQIRFTKSIWDLLNKAHYKKSKVLVKKTKFIVVNTGDKGESIQLKRSDILFCEGAKNYIFIVTKEHKYLVYLTMNEIEKRFKKSSFIRVHRSFYVNTDKIVKIAGNVITVDSYHLPVGPSFRKNFLTFLKKRTLISLRR